jgi:four helix bundle protein
MKNSKIQDPRSRETPSAKIQSPAASLVDGWHTDPAVAWVLNDGPLKDIAKPHPFDLEERTATFGERLIRFVKKIPRGPDFPENNRLIDQLIGAGTSIGANYCEANEGGSKKDFRHPVSRCVKEAKETRFFLRMVAASEPKLADEARELYREANELVRIFASMYRK